MTQDLPVPVCMVFSGHDPSGGAGLQTDIEAIASTGAHAVTVATATTVQDTSKAHAVEALPASLLIEQARTLFADISIAAIKIGLIPNVEIAEAIHGVLLDFPDIPVVLDPVIKAGGGQRLQDEETSEAAKTLLFPQTTVLTPNGPEARYLASNADTLDACGMSLLESGCEYVLVTGGHEPGEQIINKLYGNNRCLEQFKWPRLTGEYRGTGCMLASAIAALLSYGEEPHSAIREAQKYASEAIKHARQIGQGQKIPNRLYWATPDAKE